MNYKHAYYSQKSSARQRNIEWHFTYEEWINWWGIDILNRGCRKGQLVMARNMDQGPYHPDNVRKATCGENAIESATHRTYVGIPKTNEQKIHLSNKLKGRIDSEETKIKKSLSMKLSHAKRKQIKETTQ